MTINNSRKKFTIFNQGTNSHRAATAAESTRYNSRHKMEKPSQFRYVNTAEILANHAAKKTAVHPYFT